MKRKVFIGIIHAVLLLLIIVHVIIFKKGPDYFEYIYALNVNIIGDMRLFEAAALINFIFFIVDAVCVITNLIRSIRTVFQKKYNEIELRKLLFWIIIFAVSIISLRLYLIYYIAFLT